MPSKAIIDQLRAEIGAIESSAAPRPNERRPGKDAKSFASAQDSRGSDAFAKITRLVNAGDKSECTIRKRLNAYGYTDADMEASIEKAKAYGLIDDRRFADVLIRSRIRQGRGLAGIERELRENGIEADLLEGWPYEYTSGLADESERALAFLETHPPRSKNLRDGAYRKLVQKGFSASAASSAARLWAEGQQAG